ncbi:MAG: hypothetical protein NVSMB68_02850 [Thermoanaerobaculia bacterium]
MKKSLAVIAFLSVAAMAAGPDSDRAKSVVQRSIDRAGGWSAWMATRTVQFRKTATQYNADGTVKGTRVQSHRYTLHPSMRMRIEWEDNGSKIVLINNGTDAWKFVDGKPATSKDDVNSARNATFGSHYVFNMPFKLFDPGVSLTWAGSERLPDGTTVDKVRPVYARGIGDAGGMHTWTYYFDAADGRLTANHLQYAPDRYDYTEYDDDKPVGALVLSTHRRGYDADEHGKRGPMQSEIWYDQIRVNEPLAEELFEPPR